MSHWTSILESSFMPLIRSRGEKYFRDKRVDVHNFSPTEVEAVVHGTTDYHTGLQIDGEHKVGITCTCPFFKQGYPCKHLWATALAADSLIAEYSFSEHDFDMLREVSPGKTGKKKQRRKPRGKKGEFWKELVNETVWKGGVSEEKRPDVRQPGSFMLSYKLVLSMGEILVTAYELYIKKDGKAGRERRITSGMLAHPALGENDRIILSILNSAGEQGGYDGWYTYSSGNTFEDIILSPENLAVVLPRLAETGRCRIMSEYHHGKENILCKGNPFDYNIKFRVEHGTRKKKLSVDIVLDAEDGSNRFDFQDDITLISSEPVFFLQDNRLFRLNGPSGRWINKLHENKGFKIRKKEIREFVRQAETVMKREEAVELPDKLAPAEIEAEPSPFLVVSIGDGRITGTLHMDYDGLEIAASSPGKKILDHERWKRITRDMEAEQGFREIVEKAGFEEVAPWEFAIDTGKASEALPFLDRHGITVEAIDKKRISYGSSSKLSIRSGIDWFDLEGGIDFGGEIVPLARVVRAFLKGRKTITLGSGAIGMLPEEWLQRNFAVLEMGKAVKTGKKAGEKLRFHSSQTMLLDSMLEEMEQVSLDSKFLETRKKIQDFTGIKPEEPPVNFNGKLRGYQKDAMGWFRFLQDLGFGGILADDMGLGKTVQVLAMLAGRRAGRGKKIRPSLVVAPTTLVFNWQLECEQFVPDMKCLVYTGLNRAETFNDFDSFDLVITSYGIVRRDIKKLAEFEFDYIVLDESQAIKNSASQIAKAVRLLRCQHKLCLTGTPLENHVGELWSQMEFLNPGLLGSWSVFDRRFIKPVAAGDKKAMEMLKQLVMPFMLRRTKEKVIRELPDKVENIVRCSMSPAQADIYNGVREHYRAEIMSQVERKGMNRSKMRVLEGLLRLRQAANHPALVGHESMESGKMNELLTLVKEAVQGEHKALVFSQFTAMLRLIRIELDQQGITYEYLDGRTPVGKRQAKVQNFQNNEKTKLFLISLKAGGTGLNLTAADYVFLVDPWWNPAVELQAVDRTHRIGQTRKVFTYKLITSGTIEEKVLQLQEKKRDVVNSIMSGSRDIMKELTAADLELLFS
jgi:superfamily II DNA or RNA helicase